MKYNQLYDSILNPDDILKTLIDNLTDDEFKFLYEELIKINEKIHLMAINGYYETYYDDQKLTPKTMCAITGILKKKGYKVWRYSEKNKSELVIEWRDR